MTRRIIKPRPEYCGGGRARDPQNWSDPDAWGWENHDEGCWDLLSEGYTERPYYAPGDRLWVREAWRAERGQDRQTATEIAAACLDAGYSRVWCPTFYEVDGERVNFENGMVAGRYRHARFMPRWASRLTLTVTEVRVQRLQEISEADARAEGARGDACGPWGCEGLIEDFSDLWNRIHGDDAWDTNPWIVALTFTVAKGNIDHA